MVLASMLIKAEGGFLEQLKQRYHSIKSVPDGVAKEMAELAVGLMKGFVIAILFIYMLMAVPLKSYTQPLIIMMVIPFGITGAILGHWITGYTMSMISLFGVIALGGVVVNDSLVLIDYANRLHRNQGLSAFDAIHQAGIRRFRPIILTTFTTFGGLAPMIFETSMQARFLIPMAISLGFGILFATVITLILIPCLYVILEDFKSPIAALSRQQI